MGDSGVVGGNVGCCFAYTSSLMSCSSHTRVLLVTYNYHSKT